MRPSAIVCLGATAAQALLGRSFRVTQARGERVASPLAPIVMATVHPSAILRARTDADRGREREAFAADLSRLAGYLARQGREAAAHSKFRAASRRRAKAIG